jgi:hypothetical protein
MQFTAPPPHHTPRHFLAHFHSPVASDASGNFYAVDLTEALNVEQSGGLVRFGFLHYNTIAEVDKVRKSETAFTTARTFARIEHHAHQHTHAHTHTDAFIYRLYTRSTTCGTRACLQWLLPFLTCDDVRASTLNMSKCSFCAVFLHFFYS